MAGEEIGDWVAAKKDSLQAKVSFLSVFQPKVEVYLRTWTAASDQLGFNLFGEKPTSELGATEEFFRTRSLVG